MPWSAIIGAASSLLGGALNRSSSSNANDRANDMAMNNLAKQEEFAQKAVTWRARDVMNAYKETGIHPLAMLGVQGAQYTPVSANFTPSGMGDSVARAGQDIGRAINANADRSLRREALEMQRMQLNNAAERGSLENELLRINIMSARGRLRQELSPALPGRADKYLIPGQGETAVVPPHVENKTFPDVVYSRTKDGGLYPVPSTKMKDQIEDNFWHQSVNFYRNNILPWISRSAEGPIGRKARPGYTWEYSGAYGWKEVPQYRNKREMLHRFKKGW